MRIAIDSTASRAVVQTTTIEMTDATTLARIRIEDRIRNLADLMNDDVTHNYLRADQIVDVTIPVLNLADPMIDDVIPNRRKVDARTLVRLVVDQIVCQIASVRNLVALTIDVVTPNHRKAAAATSVRLVEDQIVGLTALVLNLVDQMIDDATFNRRTVDVMASVHLTVVRAVTLVRRSAVPVTIAADSFRLTVAIVVASLPNMAAVTIEDVAISVLRSADRIVIVATWGHRRTANVVALIVAPDSSFHHTAVPIVDAVISVRRCTGQAVIVATSDLLRAVVATNVVAMIATATEVVRNRQCATHSASSAFVLWLVGLDRTTRALGIPWARFV